MWSGNLKSAIASLRLNKWRSFLTMLGVIVGVSSVVTVVSLGEGLKQQVVGQINQLGEDVLTVRSGRITSGGVGNAELNILALLNTSTLTDDDVATIAELPKVAATVPINFVTNTASSENRRQDNLYVIGTTGDLDEMLNQKVAYGTFFENDSTDTNQVVIGSRVAAQLLRRLNPVGHTLQISGQEFIVQGVLEQSAGGLLSIAQTDFNSAILMPLEASKKLTGDRTNILQILVRSEDPDLDQVVADIEKSVSKNHSGNVDFSVLKQEELLSIASGVVNVITAFITAIAAVSLLVGGIGIMAIMLVSVSERTREIGIRKAVGATNRQILNQFLLEGLVLSVGGGIIGILIALAANGLIRLYTNLDPVVNLRVLIFAAIVSIGVGIIFGVAPAAKAARKHPIDALRNG